jgi:hypothetical protein
MPDADTILQAVEQLIQEYLKNGCVKFEAYKHVDNLLKEYFNELHKKNPGAEITPSNCWLAHELDVDRTYQGGDKTYYGNAGDLLNDISLTFEN